jgi:hypothetical protein
VENWKELGIIVLFNGPNRAIMDHHTVDTVPVVVDTPSSSSSSSFPLLLMPSSLAHSHLPIFALPNVEKCFANRNLPNHGEKGKKNGVIAIKGSNSTKGKNKNPREFQDLKKEEKRDTISF